MMKYPFFANNDLITRRIDTKEGINLQLAREVVYYLDGLRKIIVEEGFESDLASIPKFLWPLFPPTGQYDKAAVIHDYLYRGGVIFMNGYTYRPSKVECDRIFLEAMKILKVSFWRRRSMYYGVLVFGYKHYVR